jgi:hypothetical protein
MPRVLLQAAGNDSTSTRIIAVAGNASRALSTEAQGEFASAPRNGATPVIAIASEAPFADR